MAPVPGRGLSTPDARQRHRRAADVARLLGRYGATVTVLDGPAGAAAERKLLRSVFYKGHVRRDRRGPRCGPGAGIWTTG